jgi:hypothetical protein
MQKIAFTLIEIIFVIILVAILAIGALNSIPDNTLINNTEFIYGKILEKKANALGFLANMNDKDENRSVCIVFDNDWLKEDENFSKVKFKLSNRVQIDAENKTICFDYLGRPYGGDVDLINFNNLLHKSVDINITYVKDKRYKTITIYPITGYVEIK